MKNKFHLTTTTTTTATPRTIKSYCRRHLLLQSLQTLDEKMICKSVVLTLVLCSVVSAQTGYPSVLLRCTQCAEAETEEGSGEVCGSDWKTYSSLCQLEWEACKRNWSIMLVSEGQCLSQCQDVDLGKYVGRSTLSLENHHRPPRYVLCYWNISGNKQGKLHPGLLQVQETFKPKRTGGPSCKRMLSRKVSSPLGKLMNFVFPSDLASVVILWSRSLGLTENHSHKTKDQFIKNADYIQI